MVSGEPSGDRAAAKVIAHLGARAFGMAGEACEAAGLEPVVSADGRAAMGALDVARRMGRIAASMLALRRAIARRRPRVALLVSYTDYNARLLGVLRRHGVRVVWYAAPQVWAWRPGRARSLAPRIDAMAVVLPFEESLWQEAGVQTRFVGHPSMDGERLSRREARALLGFPPDDDRSPGIDERNAASRSSAGVGGAQPPMIAVLPGSRPGEVRRLLPAMLEAARGHAARALLASGLDDATRAWARALCISQGVAVHEPAAGAGHVLAAFDAAVCASGTASLECSMAGVPPVVAYRVDPLAAVIARRMLRTRLVALHNVLLARRAFPELLQSEATAANMRRELDALLSHPEAPQNACREVQRILGSGHEPSRSVAAMIARWL